MSIIEHRVKFANLVKDFTENSVVISQSKLNEYQSLITFVLALISFVSVASALLNKKGNFLTYVVSALVASISIALTSIYACNFFGVYI